MSTTNLPKGWEKMSQHFVLFPGYTSTDPRTGGMINIVVYGLYKDLFNFRQILSYTVHGIELGIKIVDSNAKKCKIGEEKKKIVQEKKIVQRKKTPEKQSFQKFQYTYGMRAWIHDQLNIRYG